MIMNQQNAFRYYLNNVLSAYLDHEEELRLFEWVDKHSPKIFGRDVKGEWQRGEPIRRGMRNRCSEEECEAEQNLLPRSKETLLNWLNSTLITEPVSETADAILNAFHLDQEYLPLITFWCLAVKIPELAELAYERSWRTENKEMIPGLLGITKTEYERFFILHSPLWKKGLLGDSRMSDLPDKPSNLIVDIVRAGLTTSEDIRKFVLGKPLEAELDRTDFEHVKEYQRLSDLLESCSRKKIPGVNLLVYGQAGTGKTEMTKTICRDLHLKLYAISQQGREHNSEERRRDLARAIALMEDAEESVLLVDECEDLWEGGINMVENLFSDALKPMRSSSNKSKLFFHHLLESAQIPIIWIANGTRGVDTAHLRRFRFAVEMQPLSEETRGKIWNNCAVKFHVNLTAERIQSLVSSYNIPPALMESALKNASEIGDDSIIEETLDSLLTAMGKKSSAKIEKSPEKVPFSTELLNTSENLERLANVLKAKNNKHFSLLLSGVSGSGKSAYARYLAEQLKMPFICKKCSDLISKWVGETEQNIARAFAEAKATGSLLCFDECDSWLRDRRHAVRNWEITQVNEMLTQMESHDGPFVCTTNLHDEIDQAAYRRFLWKVRYDYLKPEQVAKAFRHFLGVEIPNTYSSLTALAPGDFENVRRSAELLEITDPEELLEMLKNEQESKGSDTRSHFVGFAC